VSRARSWAGTAAVVAKTVVVLLALLQALQLLGVTRVELARADTTPAAATPVGAAGRSSKAKPPAVGDRPAKGRLTAAQIAALARQAGFRGEDLTTATAVALAESGGRADAVGDTSLQNGTWGPSVGLWQIRSLHEQRGTGGVRDELANRDPATNARHARAIASTERGWRHWSVVLHGTYRAHLSEARRASGVP
jgi:hypothetical protein